MPKFNQDHQLIKDQEQDGQVLNIVPEKENESNGTYLSFKSNLLNK